MGIGHIFLTNKILKKNLIFCKKGVVQKKRTMNEQNGSFKEMKKKIFNERMIQNLFKDFEKRSFFTEQTIF